MQDNIYVNQLINNLNQIIMNQLTQKIVFFTTVSLFVVTLVTVVVYNAINSGMNASLGF